MKKILLTTFVMILLILSVGCSQRNKQSYESKIDGTKININPFKSDDADTVIMGGLSHRPSTSNIDGNKNLIPWVYTGEEVKIEYYVNASGQAKNVGFFIFVNGMPQPYKIEGMNGSYEYMQTFELQEDDMDVPFTFIFSPVTGGKGETLDVIISSIYNPSFIPDMDKTSSYGGYHALLPAYYQLTLESEVKDVQYEASEIVENIKISNEPVTNELLETLSYNNMREINTDTFNNEIFSLIYYDNNIKMDNYKVGDDGTLQITYKLCGCAGLEYTTIFYINHKPIVFSEGVGVDTTIEKGYVSVIELDIDLEKLDELNTFYIISVPKNAKKFPKGIFEAIKTQSILLHKEGE